MSHKAVFITTFWLFACTLALTVAAIIVPEWITWETQTPFSKPIRYNYGLHTRCSSLDLDAPCHPFPRNSDCSSDSSFCSLWRTAGFLMSFAVVLELVAIATCVALIFGGKQARFRGWMVLTGFIVLCGVVQVTATGVVGWAFNHDDKFIPGWKLDSSYWICLSSWVVQLLIAAGVVTATYTLEEEGGYELIPDREQIVS